MNGIHDMGGLQCFGPIVQEDHEPLFHEPWERRVFAMTLAMGATGQWNLDKSRFVRESLPADIYLTGGYYRIWLEALLRLLEEKKLVSGQELSTGRATQPRVAEVRTLAAENVVPLFNRGWASTREPTAPAKFCVGDAVRTIQHNPEGHTRLPRYARDRTGTIAAVHGVHVFPDTHAAGLGEQPNWLYSVRFEAHTLWGPDTTADAVYLDCWQSYLIPIGDQAPSLPPKDQNFQAPWEAKAFALVVSLSQAGLFTWSEWVSCFSRHVAKATEAQAQGMPAKSYYEQWVDAAEEMLVSCGITSHEQLLARRLSAVTQTDHRPKTA